MLALAPVRRDDSRPHQLQVALLEKRRKRMRCSCGFGNLPVSHYCGGCGTRMANAGDLSAKPIPLPSAGERRQVTVLFCDLVGSTQLSDVLDPEDYSEILLAYREACAVAIERRGGKVVRYIGDGLLVCFGYPVAREDDALRAVRTALDIVASVESLGQTSGTAGVPSLRARVGVHTGLAVVGALRGEKQVEIDGIVGRTPNVAARLQEVAQPGQVILSGATRRLTAHRIRLTELGERRLKGVAEAMEVYLATSEVSMQDGMLQRRPRTPFMNRQAELAALLEAFESARAGSGGGVLLQGGPGLGKSRLVHEFRNRIGAPGQVAATLACASDDRSSAFYPVLEWLRAQLGDAAKASTGEQRAQLAALVEERWHEARELVPPLAALLGIGTEADEAELAAQPRRRRRRGIQALVRVLMAQARDGPAILVVEDAHWADDSTLTLLEMLVERVACLPLLVLLTSREPDLMLRTGFRHRIELSRLNSADARFLAEQLADGRLEASVLDSILARSDGVPFYLEEVTWTAVGRSGAETAGVYEEQVLDVPLTLRDSLTAQLDTLGEVRSVAQLASVIGRSFRPELLQAVARHVSLPVTGPIEGALSRLEHTHFLERDVSVPHDAYIFRHALIQEVAYKSLLREQRERYHLQVARVLQRDFGSLPEARPEILANHFAAGARWQAAVDALEAAAARARAQSANVEAAEHCERALKLLQRLPEVPERLRREAQLEIALAAQLLAARGNAAPGVERALGRVRALAERLEDPDLETRALRGLQTMFMVRGDIHRAHEISVQLMGGISHLTDPGMLLQIHRPYGLCLLYLGRFRDAQRELRRTLDLYDPVQHAGQRFDYGSDPAVLAHCHLGWAEWFLGDEIAAEAAAQAAIRLARELDHAHSLCFALAFLACLEQFRDRPDGAIAAADEMTAIALNQEFPYWCAWGKILRGWARGRAGLTSEGEQELREGIADYARTGAALLRPYALFLLAHLLQGSRPETALQALEGALEEANAQAILFWHPQMLGLQRDLVRRVSLVDSATC